MSAKSKSSERKEKSEDEDMFGIVNGGVARYENFVRHFPLHAETHDESNFSITFSYPCFSLDPGRYGFPHLSDLLFPAFPLTFYHLTNLNPKTNKPWLYDFRANAQGKPYSSVSIASQLKIDRAVYDGKTSLSDLKGTMTAYKGGPMNAHSLVEMFTSDRKQHLFTCYSNLVNFDLSARSPVKIPDNVSSRLKPLDLTPYNVNRYLAEPAPPPHAFLYPVLVVWGNLDANGHMCFHWYSRHTMDGIAMAITSSESRAVDTLSVHHLEAGVSCLHVQYIKECCYGDRLQLRVWQADDRPADVKGAEPEVEARCWIEREGEVVAKVAVRFYTPR